VKDHPQQTWPNLRLMLVSLLLSLLTWISLSGRSSEATQVRVFPQIPLLHQNIPKDMKLKTDNYQISVALNGLPKDLNGINPSSDIKVMLDLEGYSEGEWTMPLTTEDVVISGGRSLTIENIIPDTVRLQLERVATKQLKLTMATVGNPAPNFELKKVILIPNEVTITGPAAQLENLEYLEAEPVNIEGADATLTGRIILNSSDIPVDSVIRQLGNLRYRITIEETKIRKRFKAPLPVQTAEPTSLELHFNPTKVVLEIYGPVSAVEWFDPSWIVPELLISAFITEDPLEPIESEGNDPPPAAATSQKQMVPISNRWQIPEEIKQNDSNWAAKISKLQLKWFPGQVEVEQK